MSTTRVRRRPRRGIDLYERNFSPALFEFLQSEGELLDFLRQRFLAVDGGEEALNNDRTPPADRKDVGQYLFDRHIDLVYSFQISLRAPVELHPDFVGPRKKFQALLHLGLVESGSVSNKHQFEKWKSTRCPNVNNCLDSFDEVRSERRFAITA